MLAPLPEKSHPTLAAWQALERRTKREFDQGMIGGKVDHGFWWTFHTHLLQRLNAADVRVRDTLVVNPQNSANWDQILPGTREALEKICQQYPIAVISNADGKIDAVLRRCGIFDCFASITDSGIVGREKPHPAIFAAALREMNADPAESLYVGDVFCRLSWSSRRGHAGSALRCCRGLPRAGFPAWNRSASWKIGLHTKSDLGCALEVVGFGVG